MNEADLLLAVMWIGVTLYAVMAGADFGAGFWDLTAGGAKSGLAPRSLIARTIGPLWEANHVWLIFVLVVLWTGFPVVFASVASTLYVPLTGAAIGIILRGAGFAFRKAAPTIEVKRLFGGAFALSSVITPFFLGTIAGAVASGRVPAGEPGDIWDSWINPTSFLGGGLAVLTAAFLASVFLTHDAEREGEQELVGYFRKRALASGVIAGIGAVAGIFALSADAPELFDGLRHRAAPLVGLSALGGLGTMFLLVRRSFVLARGTAVLAVAAVVWGWAVAQYPEILVDELTVEQASGDPATLRATLISLGVGSLLFGPPLVWLLYLFQRTDATEE